MSSVDCHFTKEVKMSSLNYGFLLNLEIYNAVIVFSLGGDKEGIIDFVKDNVKEGSGIPEMLEEAMSDLNKTGFGGQCDYYDDPEIFLVWLKEFDPMQPNDWSSLAHELFHLTMHIMDSRENKYDPENHESFAYLNGYLHKVVNESVNEALEQKKNSELGVHQSFENGKDEEED
jgi:hypothetical protein